MKTTKIDGLCESLSMNFDEANELFGAETLNSMQMANVSGSASYSLSPLSYFNSGDWFVYVLAEDEIEDGTPAISSYLALNRSNGMWFMNGQVMQSGHHFADETGMYASVEDWENDPTTGELMQSYYSSDIAQINALVGW